LSVERSFLSTGGPESVGAVRVAAHRRFFTAK
jgi:hypothetical protein